MKVISKPLSELHVMEKNIRRHPEKQIKEYVRSLEMFGQMKPVVIDEAGMILAGNGLFEALRSMGAETCQCYVMKGLSPAQKKKVMLADNRVYELGITDFISRPFDALIVHRRVVNTILLYAKQKRLTSMVAEQIFEKEHRSSLMIDILSHIVEFRNGESGMHVRHVHTLTETMLQTLVQKTDRYHISPTDISVISTASALHDIGKIAIPEEILNKPGRFTPRSSPL